MSFRAESENYKYWTATEELKLKELVDNGKGFKEIGGVLNRTSQSCQDHSRILGFKSSYVERRYKVNEIFWDIPNSINCYFAGVFLADGSINYYGKDLKSCTLSWEISTKDEHHIYEFLKHSDCEAKPMYLDRNGKFPTIKICMNCPEWKKPLAEIFSLIPNKTRRINAPKIYDNFLQLCLCMGVIDGDGCVYYNKVTDQVGIKIDSSSKPLLDWICEVFDTNFRKCARVNKFPKVRKLNHADCYEISFNGVRACVIVDYLRHFPLPKLDRKWNNPEALAYIEAQKQKHPHLFRSIGTEPQAGSEV